MILWDLDNGEPIEHFIGHNAVVRAVAFSPDGHSVLSGSNDGTMRLWRIQSRDELIAWTKANRFVPTLTCDQVKRYHLDASCAAQSAVSKP
jgi:WD40 repeat protein